MESLETINFEANFDFLNDFLDDFNFNSNIEQINANQTIQEFPCANVFNQQICLLDSSSLNNQFSFENVNNSPGQFDYPSSVSSSPNSYNLEPVNSNSNFEFLPAAQDANTSQPESGATQEQIQIILNFDQLHNDLNVEELQKEFSNLSENIKVIVEGRKETCIDLNSSYEMTESVDETIEEKTDARLALTEEEKSVFIKEGYKLPTHFPMTKSEEKILKIVRRKIRNKKSAHVSRERKKKYIDGLEKRVEMCTKKNEKLAEENKELKQKNFKLETQIQNLQNFLGQLINKHKKSSTAVLFVSFLLTFCFYPYMNGDDFSPDEALQMTPFKGFSRTLLSVDENMSSANAYNSTINSDIVYSYYRQRFTEI